MPKISWSYTPPKHPGTYRWRNDPSAPIRLVTVDAKLEIPAARNLHVDEAGGEWWPQSEDMHSPT